MINALQTNGSLRLDSGSYRQYHLGEGTKRARLTQFKATLKDEEEAHITPIVIIRYPKRSGTSKEDVSNV